MIDSYSFGKIVIQGKEYTNDILIYQDTVYPDWWRKSGHCLCIEDLKLLIDFRPSILVIGTGNVGAMKVPDKCLEELRSEGIEVRVQKTEEACKVFNELIPKEKVSAALHLTC